MSTANEIILRPRFKMELKHSNQSVLKAFEGLENTEFKISRVDDHVFIRLPKHKQHFWSPQLHLEVNELEPEMSMLHGLFGPNPTVWTLFMFIHFFVAGMFIAFGIWCYTNWTLEKSYGIQLGLMILMILVWIGLYVAGRMGRLKGKPEMHQLYDFMNDALRRNHLL
jgi:hypothetical protein